MGMQSWTDLMNGLKPPQREGDESNGTDEGTRLVGQHYFVRDEYTSRFLFRREQGLAPLLDLGDKAREFAFTLFVVNKCGWMPSKAMHSNANAKQSNVEQSNAT